MATVSVTGLVGVAHLACGGCVSCALGDAGSLSCWGRRTWGQLGDGTGLGHPVPVAVALATTAL